MALETSELTDEQLAAVAAREDSDGPAFLELLARHQQRVWRICWRLMGSQEDTNDAAQEVCVRMFLHRAKFAGRSRYSTWVHGIAARTCLAIRRGRSRRQRREKAAGELSARKTDKAGGHHTELALDLAHMLETLDETDRGLLIMKYAEGHRYEELAQMFDLSVSACKMRISRAREHLKQRFPEQSFGTD